MFAGPFGAVHGEPEQRVEAGGRNSVRGRWSSGPHHRAELRLPRLPPLGDCTLVAGTILTIRLYYHAFISPGLVFHLGWNEEITRVRS